jgi:hypothetical protein
LLGGGGVLSALRAGMLEKARRAKGERRCWLKAARRRDILGVEVRRRLVVGVDIVVVEGFVGFGLLYWEVGKKKTILLLAPNILRDC